MGVRPLSRNPVDFEVARVCFNPANDAYLAVAGFAEARVFVLNEDGEVVDRLRVGPETWPLDGARGAILDVKWVPCEPACVAIVVETHVAVFDLSVSAAAPAGVARLASGDGVVAAAFARRKGASALLLLADTGDVYAHALEGGADAFRRESDIVVSSASRLALPEECRGRAGLDLHYSEAHGVAFAAFDGGASAAFKLDFNFDSAKNSAKTTCACVLLEGALPEESSSSVEQKESSVAPSGFSRWNDACVPPAPPLAGAPAGPTTPPLPHFVAVSARRGGSAVLVSLAEDAFAAQPLAGGESPPEVPAGGSALGGTSALGGLEFPKPLGHCGFQPTDMDVAFLFALMDDGSLRVFAREPAPPPGVAAADAQRAQLARAAERAAGAAAAAKMAGGADDPESRDRPAGTRALVEEQAAFPLDFFEHVECVTAQTRFGGDLARGRSSESVRFALAAEASNGGVEAPGPGAHDLVLTLIRPDHVIRGLRVHVGDGSAARVPRDLRIGPKPPAAFDRLGESLAAAGTDPSDAGPSGGVDARRRVAFETGARRWYDVPLTEAETVAAGRELVVTFGEATSPSAAARVDHVEVYAVSKAAFGWDREAALARAAAGSGADTRADAGAEAESDAESDAEATSKTATRLERIVRHADGSEYDSSSMTRLETREEERALRAALASLARAAAFEDSAETKEKAAALALRVLEPFVEPFDGIPLWMPRVATRRVAWRALLAAMGNSGVADSVAAAAARKDAAAMASITERVTRQPPASRRAAVPRRRTRWRSTAPREPRLGARSGDRPPSPARRRRAPRAQRWCASPKICSRRAPARGTPRSSPATWRRSPSPSPSRHMRKSSPDESSKALRPGDDGSSSGGAAPGVGDAARLAATLLLAGRDDARRAAADALTDALVAPAPAHPPRDYARALRPDGSDSDEAPHSSSGNDSAVFFSSALASAARDGTRTADRLDRASQDTISTRFSCDACGASPIVRRRWHCALCADYDECDACQARAQGESLGAAVPPETRFHPTHDATHPMIPFECVTDGREREGIHVAGFETYAGEENGVERARGWRRPTSALDDDVLSHSGKPSDGKVALARARRRVRGRRRARPNSRHPRTRAVLRSAAPTRGGPGVRRRDGPRGARRRARVGGGGGGVAFGAERVRDGAIRRRRREGASSPGVLVPRARRDARLCASEHDSRRHERRERPDPAAPRLAPRRGGGVARARATRARRTRGRRRFGVGEG